MFMLSLGPKPLDSLDISFSTPMPRTAGAGPKEDQRNGHLFSTTLPDLPM